MSDTTTGTTNPLSMEDAKTLKFIAELQGQCEQEREHADRLAEALRNFIEPQTGSQIMEFDWQGRVARELLAEHAKLRGAQ